MPVPMPFAPRRFPEVVAVRCFDDVLVIDAFSVGEHGRGFHGQPTKFICIRGGDFAPSRVVLIQGRKFNPQDTHPWISSRRLFQP